MELRPAEYEVKTTGFRYLDAVEVTRSYSAHEQRERVWVKFWKDGTAVAVECAAHTWFWDRDRLMAWARRNLRQVLAA